MNLNRDVAQVDSVLSADWRRPASRRKHSLTFTLSQGVRFRAQLFLGLARATKKAADFIAYTYCNLTRLSH
jgi:hypothetical protein